MQMVEAIRGLWSLSPLLFLAAVFSVALVDRAIAQRSDNALESLNLYDDGGQIKMKREGPPPLPTSRPDRLPDAWRVDRSPECAGNVAFLFLRLCGVEVTRDDVLKAVPSGARGTNLLDLRNAIGKYGVDVRAVECPAESLNRYVPVIARLGASDDEGHYVLVRQIDEELVFAVDGTTAMSVEFPLLSFDQEYSGHAIIRDDGSLALRAFTGLNGVFAVLVLLEVLVLAGLVVLIVRRKMSVG